MRFALVGNDPEGMRLARALVASGRHQLLYSTSAAPAPIAGASPRTVNDLEEILADPAVEAVLIASRLDQRAEHVRRALQSERTVLCLHPVATRPEPAYEAGMLQQETRQLLLPLFPEAHHPAVERLRALFAPSGGELGSLRLVEIDCHSPGEVLLFTEENGERPTVPFWALLRAVGGEVAELSALCPGEELQGGVPVLVSGRFEGQGLFQMRLVPGRPAPHLTLRFLGSEGEAELLCREGHLGRCVLNWVGKDGQRNSEWWESWDPGPPMVPMIEQALERHQQPAGVRRREGPSWQDEVHCLELDDAAHRSASKRRTIQLEYPEATEEVSFKGTMTLVGCALLWVIIFLAILSRWFPKLGWVVGPVLAVFLILQTLRWLIPPREADKPTANEEPRP